MFRTAYTEDYMATLAVQSMSIWDELEDAAGEPLRLMTGLLNFGDPNYGVRFLVFACASNADPLIRQVDQKARSRALFPTSRPTT